MAKLKVTFVKKDWPKWKNSRFWSYGAHLGIADALRAEGADVEVVDEAFLPSLCSTSGRSDQIWFDDLVHLRHSAAWYEQASRIAPIRVGWLVESLNYTQDEWSHDPELEHERKQSVYERLPYMTHAVACDEVDAREIEAHAGIPGFWAPFSVPDLAFRRSSPVHDCSALFCGTVYGTRARYLEMPELQGTTKMLVSDEDSSIYRWLFEGAEVWKRFVHWPRCGLAVAAYNQLNAKSRQELYRRFLIALQGGAAVINLRHLVKTYSPRVVEAMAVGRPVISWRIPSRPKNLSLFEDGEEILLYEEGDFAGFAELVTRMTLDRKESERIAAQARERVAALHTTRCRVRHVLRWIQNGTTPYSV